MMKDLTPACFQGYRVMYRLEPDRVLVLAVMHGSRDVAGVTDKPWDEK
jgi:plasmid stabilization system protein ParE